MSTTSDDSKIKATESEVAQAEFDPEMPAGVPEGHVDKDDESIPEPVRERIDHREVVVHDVDNDGNATGSWHKEAAPAPDGEVA